VTQAVRNLGWGNVLSTAQDAVQENGSASHLHFPRMASYYPCQSSMYLLNLDSGELQSMRGRQCLVSKLTTMNSACWPSSCCQLWVRLFMTQLCTVCMRASAAESYTCLAWFLRFMHTHIFIRAWARAGPGRARDGLLELTTEGTYSLLKRTLPLMLEDFCGMMHIDGFAMHSGLDVNVCSVALHRWLK
jgi:hypothetical protein